MRAKTLAGSILMIAGLVGMGWTGSAYADRPERKEHRSHGHEYRDREHGRRFDKDRDDDRRYRHERHGHPRVGPHSRYSKHGFSDKHRGYWSAYYRDHYGTGHCPPGLAKKHNGCLPPGKAKWRVGYPLPRDVRIYDVPPAFLVRLDPPPRGYRYVRVDDDILMLGVGTNLVIDALTRLSR